MNGPGGMGLCGKCGALPNAYCKRPDGRTEYICHADRYPIGFRRTLPAYRRMRGDRRPRWAWNLRAPQ